jgi:hypothetical protein
MTYQTDTSELIVVRLSISQWYPRKFDKKASDELARLHGAQSAAEIGRFNKILIDLDSIRPLQRALRELQLQHYAMTAPWNDDGVRVLPSRLYFDYTQMVREHREKIQVYINDFAHNEYARQRELARDRLNGLFNEDDYPPASEIAGRFGVSVRFEPTPNPDDVRLWGIGGDAEQIANDVREEMNRTVLESQQHVVDSVVTRAKQFVERVRKYDSGEAKAFRDSAITNVREICTTVLRGLNITGDAKLESLAKELEAAMTIEPDALRHSETARETKTAEVEAILKKFGGLTGGAK